MLIVQIILQIVIVVSCGVLVKNRQEAGDFLTILGWLVIGGVLSLLNWLLI